MLNKVALKTSIQLAIETAMMNAFQKALATGAKATKDNNITPMQVAKDFADEAKKCADGIANAIEIYVKSATIMIPMGTTFTSLPTLVSPTGPVTGALTLASPTMLLNSIQ